MPPDPDVRWKQRFENFRRALIQLNAAVTLAEERTLSTLEQQGLIKAFEFTHELAWKTLKDLLEEGGATNIFGSRDATRAAFAAELLENGEAWMEMIKDRNLTTHTYNEGTAAEIASGILECYAVEFDKLERRLTALEHESR